MPAGFILYKKYYGSLKSYLQWDFEQGNKIESSHLNFFTGVGGVFYPPQALHRNVFDSKTFLKICKTADDVWLNAMAHLQGTPIVKSYTHNPKGNDFIINHGSKIRVYANQL